MSNSFDAYGEIQRIRKENQSRDAIAIQALMRVNALEKILIAKGIISENELLEHLSEMSEDLASIITSRVNKDGED